MSELKRSGEVVSMMDRLSQNQFPACALVEAYWHSQKPKNNLPKRSSIDPRGIEDALNYAFILESIGTGVARIRIAGMHLNELTGMEVRGMPISTLIAPPSRDAFGRVLVGLLNGPALMHLSLTAEGQTDTEHQARMVLLPLVDEKGHVNRVLGCLETKGLTRSKPQRFDILAAKKTNIDVLKVVPSTEHHPQLEPATGFKDAATPFVSPTDTETVKRPSYLRVIKSDN